MTKDIVWQKSSFSGGGDSSNCVELAITDGRIRLRESDEPGTELAVTRDQLGRLLGGVKGGQFGEA
ncbi:DUF397 domain-containing protein [Streptomyces atratus]|uniref:DUF397 domain-containing protein n=1 Tax=Streptomyces atratus TaxID=1893 RepID=A0A2Z5JEV3_STRAR|nr:DUF397 domain-containing protein [Streptomyces atratus]AXE78869.1 DUF397 domain-containing protein [Streptomyces atratus]